MTSAFTRTMASALAVAGMAVALTACSFSASTGPVTVSKNDVADQISAKVAAQSGQKPDKVSCPEDLKGAVGASIDCTMTTGGQNDAVNVTVTSVNGSSVDFDIVETVDKDAVADQINSQLTEQVGHPPESVTCPDNLKGTVGATLRCQLSDAGANYGVGVTVTGVQGGDVKFDIEVDDHPTP
jgi:predicted thioesterase